MANGDIYLGYSSSSYLLPPFGRRFTISDVESSRQQRTTNGTLIKDSQYTKKVFTLEYSFADSTIVNTLSILFGAKRTLTLGIELDTSGFALTYYVVMDPIKRTRETIVGDDSLWSGITVKLYEV